MHKTKSAHKEGMMYRPSLLGKRITQRIISMTLFILVSWTLADAYTLVFYGGKRVEIPDNFIVMSDAVIYETAPGMTVSYRLQSIDVLATERANNESSGSLLRRIGNDRVQQPASTTPILKANRTITNRDLEPYERARIKSEADSEKRRKELGLPSLEETRREAARRDAALDEFLAKKRLEADANFWREREAQLRAEAAARMNTNDSQREPFYWSNGIGSFDNTGFGGRFNQGFRNLGSPCGFNPSPSCLATHPFSLFNSGGFPGRRSVFVAPRINGGHRQGGGVFVSPGRRH
jgi:hypothetical protein